jgi:hypothetical protein
VVALASSPFLFCNTMRHSVASSNSGVMKEPTKRAV